MKGKLIMNNYCINLKKRKNKPYCKLLNKEITFSLCRECDSKEYRKFTSNNQNNAIFNDYWHKQELYWEENIGSKEEFIRIFRKNYLD